MYSVAAKIAEKIGVLLQNDDVNAGAGERKPSIIPAGPPPVTQHVVA